MRIHRILALTALLAGCTAKSGDPPVLDLDGGSGVPDAAGAPDGGPDVVAPIEVALSAPQVRVLSAPEYRNTVRELSRLTRANRIPADWATPEQRAKAALKTLRK